MKPVVMTPKEWEEVLGKIRQDYPPSVSLLTWKRKEKLGFHVREHSQWVDNKNYHKEYQEYEERDTSGMYLFNVAPAKGNTEHVICLDFYDESKETWFRLKYL